MSKAIIHIEADTALVAVYAPTTGSEAPLQTEISRLIKKLQDLHVRVLGPLRIDADLDLFHFFTVSDCREELAGAYARRLDEIPGTSAFKADIKVL